MDVRRGDAHTDRHAHTHQHPMVQRPEIWLKWQSTWLICMGSNFPPQTSSPSSIEWVSGSCGDSLNPALRIH